MARAWATLAGVAIGFLLTDVLNANGLRWLGWLIGALTVLILLVNGPVLRWARTRKRS
jgi:hypothetical protein